MFLGALYFLLSGLGFVAAFAVAAAAWGLASSSRRKRGRRPAQHRSAGHFRGVGVLRHHWPAAWQHGAYDDLTPLQALGAAAAAALAAVLQLAALPCSHHRGGGVAALAGILLALCVNCRRRGSSRIIR